MNEMPSPGKRIREARVKSGLTQAEFADQCRLNIRTVQRIENDRVVPRLYTLRIMGRVLGTELTRKEDADREAGQLVHFRNVFRKRRQIRVATFVAALCVLGVAFFLLFTGIPRSSLAPFVYLLLFADLVGIALTWRCPGCNKLLGDAFNQRYCSNCGLQFYEGNDSPSA